MCVCVCVHVCACVYTHTHFKKSIFHEKGCMMSNKAHFYIYNLYLYTYMSILKSEEFKYYIFCI